MAEPHVISSLRQKRAEIAGYIRDLERRVKHQRANLVHIDATIRLLSPATDPEAIPPKRVYRRSQYFAAGELSKLCLEVLRQANGSPVSTATIAAGIMVAKGWPVEDRQLAQVVGKRAGLALKAMRRRGAAAKSGEGLKAVWTVAAEAPLER
jgi:hypothetical protein